MSGTRLLSILAAAACLLGVGMTVDSACSVRRFADWQKKKAADLRQLFALRETEGRTLAAISLFDKLPDKKPEPVSDLLNALLPGSHPAMRQRETRPAAAGWSVRSVEVSFDSIRLADLARFLEKAETARPPWRLVEFNVIASDQSAGSGRASVVLEALEKR